MNLPDLLGKVKIDNGQAKAALAEVNGAAESASKSFVSMGDKIKASAAGFIAIGTAAASVGAVVKGLVMDFAKAGSELNDLNKQLGIGVVEIQKLQFAAKQSGVDFGSVTNALMLMQRAASDSPDKFARLGISFSQLRTSKPDELLSLIAQGLNGVTDQNERASIAMDLFGRGGSQMLRLLTGDFEGLKSEAKDTGLATEEMAKRADRLGDAVDKLDDAVGKLKVNMGAAFASPGMIALMEKMANAIGLMARNADNLYTALKMVTGTGGMFMSLVDMYGAGSKGEDFSGVKGGASSSEIDRVKARAQMVKRWAEEDSTRGSEHERERARYYDELDRSATEAAQTAAKMARAFKETLAKVREAWGDVWEAENAGSVSLAAGMAGNLTGSIMSDPFSWLDKEGGRTGAAYDGGNSGYVPPRSGLYTDQTATNADKATKATFDFARSLQNIANVASTSSNSLARAVASIAGGGAGIASGIKDLQKGGFGSGITGFLGKVGVIGGIASSAISIFGSLFGGGKEKKEAAERARAEAAEAELRRAQEEKDRRVAGLNNFAGGMNQWAQGGGITSQASSDRAGRFAMASFGAQMKESGDVFGALDSIAPTLEAMAKAAKEMGTELPKGISELLKLNDLDEGLKSQVSGLNMMTKGIADSGLVSKAMFDDLGAEAVATRARLEEAGVGGAQALGIMQPTLQQLYEMQKLHGYAVDETTQALLNEAGAQGLVGDQFMSTGAQMVELMKALIVAVGGELPAAFQNAAAAAESSAGRMKGAMDGVRVPGGGGVIINGGLDGDGGPGPGGPGFAGGTAFRDFGAGTQVTLHGEEAVLTKPQAERLVSMAVAGSQGSTASGGGQPIIVYVMADGEVLGTATANTIQRGGPASVAIRAALAGRS